MQFNHYNIHTEERWLCVFCQNTQQQENAHTEQLAMEVLNEETEDAANEQTAPLPSFQPANIGNNQSRTRMEWGCLRGFENINEALDYAYSEIVKWKKNFFQVPFGSVGKALVEETTRLLELFNARSDWEALALKALMVLLPLMIQKPAKNSKSRDHVKHLRRRLEMWKSGAIRGLVGECKEIQKRFAPSISAPKKNMTKLFTNLILQGKVGAACKILQSNASSGPLQVDSAVLIALREKHPDAKQASPEALITDSEPKNVEPIIYENIDSNLILRAAKSTRGSGGPSKIDSDVWRRLLCSKSFDPASENLREQVALLARRLCREYLDPKCLVEYTGCRLIPLDKDPGSEELKIRPIGIGEVLRRVVGKSIMMFLKPETAEAAGPLQTCAGLPGGADAAIHAMRETFESDETEVMLLVDAENAFNCLNREASLKNINILCPEFSKYLVNTYRRASRLYINNFNGDYILSKEGSTQGDNAAMTMYSCSTRPLIDYLAKDTLYNRANVEKAKQVWYADDSAAAGKLESVRVWWAYLCEKGPLLGYYPNHGKCKLVVKNEEIRIRAAQMFEGTGVQIITDGKPYLGSAIGNQQYVKSYVDTKVEEWTAEIKELAKIARTEPQCAYHGYNVSLSKKWVYLMRTTPNIAEYLQPLEDTITKIFIPALIGKEVNALERQIFALPVRFGGMGISNPCEMADFEYKSSIDIVKPLKDAIKNQETDFANVDMQYTNSVKRTIKSEKQDIYDRKFQEIHQNRETTAALKRSLELATEKGASTWLVTSPNAEHGFYLNKQEFKDAINLRYNWKISGIADTCACGQQNSIDHCLTCKKGGFVIMRHNTLRDTEAKLLEEACRDVEIEPSLIPVDGEELQRGTTVQDGARLDISARGLWNPLERVFFDVRVTHPNTQTNVSKPLRQIYKEQERMKKTKYNRRIIEVEKSTFVPLIFTTSGGMGPECEKMNKRLAHLIASKRNESYSDVINYIRRKLRFALLRATLIALRGFRGRVNKARNTEISEVDFSLMY